jgi:hypothetical protein
MEVPPEFRGKPGTSVPQVKPEHLKAAFELYRKCSSMPPQDVAKGPDAIQLGHTVGASLPSVSYRATMLELLTRVPQAPLAPWTREGLVVRTWRWFEGWSGGRRGAGEY